MCVCVLWCFGVGGNRRNALTGGMFVISCPPCSFLLLHTHTHVQTHLDAHAHTLRGVGTMMGEISSVCVWVWGHKNALIKIERGQNDGCLSLVPCENTHTHTHAELLFDMAANSHFMKPISPLSVVCSCLGNSPQSTVCVNCMNICALMSLALAPHTLIKLRECKRYLCVCLCVYRRQYRQSVMQLLYGVFKDYNFTDLIMSTH